MHRLHVVLFTAAVALLALGCGDDDETATGPTTTAFASGAFYLNPNIGCVDFIINGAQIIDSAHVGDSLVAWLNGLHADGFPPNSRWRMDYWENYSDTSTLMYRSGDTAQVTLWGDGRSSTARFVVLHHMEEMLPAVYPIDTTIAADAPVPDLWWNHNDYADYYSVCMDVGARTDSDGVNVSGTYYAVTTDTVFSIPERFADHLTSIYVSVWPGTGPLPGSGVSNWSGNFCSGRVCGFGAPRGTSITRSDPIRSAASPTLRVTAEDFDPRPGFLEWAAQQDQARQ